MATKIVSGNFPIVMNSYVLFSTSDFQGLDPLTAVLCGFFESCKSLTEVDMSSTKRSVLAEVDVNSSSGPPSKKAKSSTPAVERTIDRLNVFELDGDILSAAVGTWLCGNDPGTGSNASLPGALRIAPESHLKFRPPECEVFGPCWVYYTREKRGKGGTIREALKVVEGGTNNDSPRYGTGSFSQWPRLNCDEE